MIIQPCPGCAATNQVQLERIASLEAQLAAAQTDAHNQIELANTTIATLEEQVRTLLVKHSERVAERDAALANAKKLRVVTPETVKIYLTANSEYWRIQDAQACPPLRWRKGTPTEATEYALTTMFAAIDAARSAMPGSTPTEG